MILIMIQSILHMQLVMRLTAVYFAPKYRSDGQQNTTFDIIIDEPLQGDEDTPIYIIVEEGVSQLHIAGTASSSRPVIIAYLANSNQIKFDLSNNVEFRGVIYAPYASLETSNFSRNIQRKHHR